MLIDSLEINFANDVVESFAPSVFFSEFGFEHFSWCFALAEAWKFNFFRYFFEGFIYRYFDVAFWDFNANYYFVIF